MSEENLTLEQLQQRIVTINLIRNNPKINLKSDELRWYEEDIKKITNLIKQKEEKIESTITSLEERYNDHKEGRENYRK